MLINDYNPSIQKNLSEPKKVYTRTIYTNDLHGRLEGCNKFKTEVDSYRKSTPKNVSLFVYVAGDSAVGADKKKNLCITKIMNLINPTAVTLGNHEFDGEGTKGLTKTLDYAKYPTVVTNLVTKPDSRLEDDFKAKRLTKSLVVEKNNEKYGVIGLIPMDLLSRLNQQSKDNAEDIGVLDKEKTIKEVQEEVNKFTAQGINKISVISHLGYNEDVELAKNVVGIDVIYGGHTHDKLNDLKPGVNLFNSKINEPIIITQTGKDGKNVGILDVVYDENGKIIEAKNTLKSTAETKENFVANVVEKTIMGFDKKIGVLAENAEFLPEPSVGESPLCSFLCDGYKKYTGAQIIFNNIGTIRYGLKAGDVSERKIIDMLPYYNDIYTYNLSEKDVIQALNGAIDAAQKYNRTGALQVSGLEYTVGKNMKVKNVYMVNDDGSKVKLDSENPREDKTFVVCYNSYLPSSEGVKILNAPEKRIKKFDLSETELFCEYFNSFKNEPITIKATGRIKVEK